MSLKTDHVCPCTEREVAVQRWLWYAWPTLRSMLRSISQRPPGIIMQLEQTNAAPGTTIYWLIKGKVGKIECTKVVKVIINSQRNSDLDISEEILYFKTPFLISTSTNMTVLYKKNIANYIGHSVLCNMWGDTALQSWPKLKLLYSCGICIKIQGLT